MSEVQGFERAARVLEEGLAKGLFPGAALSILHEGRIVARTCVGRLGAEGENGPWGEVTAESAYDLASVTKPLVGSLLAGMLVEEGLLAWDEPASKWLPDLSATKDHKKITLRQLLSHSAGYPAWVPLYEKAFEGGCALRPRADLLEEALAIPLESAPGGKARYSDVGFLVLTALLEKVGGARLDELFAQHVSRPLGLLRTFFVPLPLDEKKLPLPRSEIAPTSRCPWRGRLLHGEVEDDNASALGGVAAHAGLFSCIEDLEKLFLLLRDTGQGTSEILSPLTLEVLWERQRAPAGTTWALGWDTPNPVGSTPPSQVGERFSRNAVGMWGFTGTSLWYDRERDLAVIFLSNRVHPTREKPDLKSFRPALHDATIADYEGGAGKTAP